MKSKLALFGEKNNKKPIKNKPYIDVNDIK